MVLALAGLRPDLESVRNEILATPGILNLDNVFEQLVRISAPTNITTGSNITVSAILAASKEGGNRGRGNRNRPRCSHCNKIGHTIDRCF